MDYRFEMVTRVTIILTITLGCLIILTNSSKVLKEFNYDEYADAFHFSFQRFKVTIEFGNCLVYCNYNRCTGFIARKNYKHFGICVSKCVEKLCLRHLQPYSNLLYQCTLSHTKFTVNDLGLGYGMYNSFYTKCKI